LCQVQRRRGTRPRPQQARLAGLVAQARPDRSVVQGIASGSLGMPRISGGAPFFLVSDVVRAAEYYRDRLGFTIRGYFFEEPPVFAMVGRDDQIIMLSLMDAGRGGSNRDHKADALDVYLWVDDV